ncbi:MAG TPA: hypothetical protein VFQ39_10650 [Longimicrobium sp.]|nr:hypothetical protein [Longimicrobium sp.]
MKRLVTLAAALLMACAAAPARAQDWSPPSRQMPEMPTADQMSGGWRSSYAAWFGGSDVAVGGVNAVAGGARGGRALQVRFTGGVRPVAVWNDRNGDGRCDLMEVYRNGALAYQLIDADYDGNANVLRVYDASGAVARETRL